MESKPTTSRTLTEAERKLGNAEYARNYRKRCKEQNLQLQQQQQQQENVTVDITNNRPSVSEMFTAETKPQQNKKASVCDCSLLKM
jgi:hypothetical protein